MPNYRLDLIIIYVHRQAVAIVFTFWSSDPGAQTMVLTLLCLAYSALHLSVKPLHVAEAHTLQATLLLCLTGVSIASTPYADALTNEAARSTAHVSTLAEGLLTVFGLAIPVAALVWAYTGTKSLRCACVTRSSCRRAAPP